MNKKQLLVVGVVFSLLLFPLGSWAAFWNVHDDSLATVTPTEYNSIVYTLWNLYRDQSTNFWGINKKNPKVTLDIDGAVRVSDAGQACNANTLGVISYHTILPDTEPHFWGCNGSSWAKLDGIPN